ncbi:winged helix-turn-helix domain-containing protein [Streptomyces sp. NPDC051217]|uniref:winged helix-turn-helix domain-containing protein n=1 Tax=Streptomyces sp. NPDC051217 TaxID=3365644 RepID=UPI0037B54BB5
MVYRIHFTVEDLARTRVGLPPPLLELSAAVRMLRDSHQHIRFGAWRRAAFAALDPRARMVLDLVEPRRMAPDFLTAARVGDPAEQLERVRLTPRSEIRRDLAHVAEWQSLPRWAHGLADDADLFQQLCASLEHVYQVLVAPHWSHVVDQATSDRALRARQAVTGGVEHLLASLYPRRIRWSPPVLEIALLSAIDGDLHLEGTGLLLVPSLFGVDLPVIDTVARPQPVVRYPGTEVRSSAGSPLAAAATPAVPGPPALAALLGNTRAAVLCTVIARPGCSTRELATFAGIAPPSASEHATTLRTAGLIRTVRYRNTALHSPTSLGLSLLGTIVNSP